MGKDRGDWEVFVTCWDGAFGLCVILSHGMAMQLSKWAGVSQETWSLTDS